MEQTAYQYSIKLLSKKDYSEFKLTQKLLKKNYDQFEVEEAIDILKEKRFLRDDIYSSDRAKSLIHKYYSNEYIIALLEKEHLKIDSHSIDELREEYSLTKDQVIKYLVQKKKNESKNIQQIATYLSSKGFSFEDFESFIQE